jgi:uncharacterized protein (TIGR02996 family)
MLHNPDQIALLRTVYLSPVDDAPRLILADWLEEHGDGRRAELIRRMVAAPSYTFFWSRRSRQGTHRHAEPIAAIRGLKGGLSSLCHDELASFPGVSSVVMRRGLVESMRVTTAEFMRGAGTFFSRHPIAEVDLFDLPMAWATGNTLGIEVVLTGSVFDPPFGNYWPLALFPERAERHRVRYLSVEAARLHVSRRALGYGRRMAGILIEPPPLPRRATVRHSSQPWPLQAAIDRSNAEAVGNEMLCGA